MTQLLEHAFQQAQQLPDDLQDALAQRILDDLREEQEWDEAFASTRDDQWDQLAKSVRQEIASNETESLDDLLR